MPMMAPRDRRRFTGVQHAVVLDAGAGADEDRIGVLIRTDDRAPPHARLVADDDIADDDGGGGDERRRRNRRTLAFVLDDHSEVTSGPKMFENLG
ncbi:MAG: hypothetical protein HYU31_06370 [Deltaproteobacteria bacterium]|nr:hypothetical protein [Deltaproteobacteria bacterium]